MRDAYILGIRQGDMGDHGGMPVLARRYGIRVHVWNAPSLEALDAAGAGSRRVYRYYECAPDGIPNRPARLYLLHTNIGIEHFEPVLPNEGTTARPSRFTAVGNRAVADDFCAILTCSSDTMQHAAGYVHVNLCMA